MMRFSLDLIRHGYWGGVLVAGWLAVWSQPALADEASGEPANTCRIVRLDMTPTNDLQIVVWVEDAAGNYVDTAYITRLTGMYGLGNRPGILEFNSGLRWPYGRRETTFPVWAHRHGYEWPLLVFQDGDDDDLSHPMGQSSPDAFYCPPEIETEPKWDAQTCASTAYTDKGIFSTTRTSRYPPRSDVVYDPNVDDSVVTMYAELNPFDAISQPTPNGGEQFHIEWHIPQELPSGEYVAWIEVSKEFDQNEFYNYKSVDRLAWSEYGLAYRGQPSVVYKVPFEIREDSEFVAHTGEYAGYGHPGGPDNGEVDRGVDGELRPPDETISTDVPGSGAARLLLTADGDDMYRVRVHAQPLVADDEMPGVPENLRAVEVTSESVVAQFLAPGDDDDLGIVAGYEVRYMTGETITAENFDQALPATVDMVPQNPGTEQLVTITELSPRLNYSIGIRAYDECQNYGGLAVLQVTTPERSGGAVDACFVATAAYGSLMEHDVAMLRRFRDRFLRTHVVGELLVQGYYTFGPALAQLVGPSDTLRRAARAGLAPLVDTIRTLVPGR